jgi:hypothetical protein
MTTKKKLLLAMACSAAIGATAFTGVSEAASNPFAAVPTSSKSYEDVAALVDNGLIYGYKKGDFDKTRMISRMEMAIFTGKAMSAMDRASAADAERINRLMKEYQSELTDLHVQIPGVKAKSDKSAKPAAAKDARIKKIPDNYDFNGLIRLRHDWGSGHYYDKSGKYKEQEFGGSNNNQILLQFNNKFAINKDWSAEVVFFGAKNSDGDSRNSGENTVGLWDFGRAYVQGPVWKGTVKMGRLKGSNVYGYSMIMGQYFEGITYTKKFGSKWTGDIGWGKIDYASNGLSDAAANENFRWRRGVSGSDMNPDGLGVNMTQAQVKYQASKNFSVVGSWWHLTARGGNKSTATTVDSKATDDGGVAAKTTTRDKSKYGCPDIGEIGFQWDASRKLTVRGMYALSSWEGTRGTGKAAYGISLQWGKVSQNNPHSSRLQLDLLHQGRYTGIKSTYDLKNKAGEGQRGFIVDYRYVPMKNIMLDFRWMHYRTIGTEYSNQMKNANQYRVQVYYYF